MGLVVRVHGDDYHKIQKFEDDVDEIVVGRDPDRCQIVLPPDETAVGREHCAFHRVVGTYRLEIRGDHLVLLGGKPALDGKELPEQCELQIGPKGPKLLLKRTGAQASTLPGTIAQGQRPGGATIVQAAQARSRRNLFLVGGVLLLLIALALVGLQRLQEQGQETERLSDSFGSRMKQVENSVDGMRGEISHVKNDLTSVGGSLGALTATIGTMADRFKTVEAKVTSLPPRIEKKLRTLRPSVYLLVLEINGSAEAGMGTAWVVDQEKGVLATNAHVAALYDEGVQAKAEGGIRSFRYRVRSCDPEPRTYTVDRVLIHPGYKEFDALQKSYMPVSTNLKQASRVQMIGACDVALLYLKGPLDDLAPAL
ncbi:MAG: hypothetical protein ACC662_03410, partial [Planctomycetota bacterium]